MTDFAQQTPWMPRLHTAAEDIAHAATLIDRGWVTVAELGGHAAGFLARNRHEIDALFVAHALRRRGTGSALITDAQAQIDRLELWTFVANAPARTFYARHGFVEVGRSDSDNDEKLPDIRFVWTRQKEA